MARLERQLADTKKQLEAETLTRVDVENRLQSMKEELAFKSQIHEQVSPMLYGYHIITLTPGPLILQKHMLMLCWMLTI